MNDNIIRVMVTRQSVGDEVDIWYYEDDYKIVEEGGIFFCQNSNGLCIFVEEFKRKGDYCPFTAKKFKKQFGFTPRKGRKKIYWLDKRSGSLYKYDHFDKVGPDSLVLRNSIIDSLNVGVGKRKGEIAYADTNSSDILREKIEAAEDMSLVPVTRAEMERLQRQVADVASSNPDNNKKQQGDILMFDDSSITKGNMPRPLIEVLKDSSTGELIPAPSADYDFELTHGPANELARKYWGHPKFYQILEEMKELHSRKNHDYAGTDDPLKNLKASERIGINPFIGVMIRLQDKWSRLESFMKNGNFMVKGEGVKDTLMDNAVYSILAIILYEEQENK